MNLFLSFRPKPVDTLKDYSAGDFFAHPTAGLTFCLAALLLATALERAGRLFNEPTSGGAKKTMFSLSPCI